ncbi:MAG: RNA methyltransferase [Nonlabens sp.]
MKVIKSLSRKRNRHHNQQFVVEGYKSINELIGAGLELVDAYVDSMHNQLATDRAIMVSSREMDAISQMTSPPGCLAVFKIPVTSDIDINAASIVLDSISDPGNMGTIIRLADWFGISQIVCSKHTVDLYNPKVVQASMGSLARVTVHYTDLDSFLKESPLPIFLADMEGTSIYEAPFATQVNIVMGSESQGLSDRVKKHGSIISIPQYGKTDTTESLNVATATAIILAEWKRVATGT